MIPPGFSFQSIKISSKNLMDRYLFDYKHDLKSDYKKITSEI